MVRNITLLFSILLCFILQCSVFGNFGLGGVVPNLIVILCSSVGFMRGERAGLLTGFLCGLLIDIFFGSFLGFYALVYMYIGFLNGKLNRVFFPEDIKLPIVLIVLSDFTYGIICYILLFLIRGKLHFPYYFGRVILPEALYTILVTLIMYPVILFINQRLEAHEKGRKQ